MAEARYACVALLLPCAVGCSPQGVSSDAAPPWFEDEATLRGIDFRHVSGASERYLMPEIMGGGAALLDVDGDGDLDAYLVQSGQSPVTASSSAAVSNQLFLNRGDGTFVAAQESGAEDPGYGMGVTAGDYDNDGDTDLYVTNVGANVLLRNDGNGRFEDVTEFAGVGDPGWGTAALFADLDNDGDLDLFIVNYVNWSLGIERDCYDYGTGARNYCDPDNYDAPTHDRLYRNDGDGTFIDVSIEAGLGGVRGNGLGAISADFDQDGRLDVFVANDKTMDRLWLNQGELRFRDEALLWGCAMDDHGVAKAGMGVAAADTDNDGDSELLVVNIEGETDSFFRNEGAYFTDATATVGLATTSRGYTRFGVALADFDNDGRLDLYEANGRVAYSPEAQASDVFAEPNLLFRGRDGGRFDLVTSASGAPLHTSRALAVGDVDGDGGLDLLVANRDAPPYLLMNRVAGDNGWLGFRVLSRTGRNAYGATVSAMIGATRVHRDVQVGGSYLASHSPIVHFGLGGESVVRAVTVRWPGGAIESFGDFSVGGLVELRRGAGVH